MQINPDWLGACLLEIDAVLVTVAATSGSVPRDAGAKMVVSSEGQYDTIGGGHLEWKAITIARDLLRQSRQGGARTHIAPQLHRLALGPSLGQCCGGVVHLLFEVIEPPHREQFKILRQRWQNRQDSWRVVPLDIDQIAHLLDSSGQLGSANDLPYTRERACHILQNKAGERYLLDPCLAWRPHLYLFGAGHVATHLVHQLAYLPCHITWVDQRGELFPANLPANVVVDSHDDPTGLVRRAGPGATFLVMTHNHTLDQELVQAVLQRDCLWLGLIGSASKRAQFESRLLAKGLTPQQLARLVSPIGLPDLRSKLPAVIAASVCAQLLQVWHNAGQLDGSCPQT